jgi:hypothetical protein
MSSISFCVCGFYFVCSSLALVSSAMLYRVRGGGDEKADCPVGSFRSPILIGPKCQPCSECPKNQIVHTLCSADADTVCSPLSELFDFEFLNYVQNADSDSMETLAPPTEHQRSFQGTSLFSLLLLLFFLQLNCSWNIICDFSLPVFCTAICKLPQTKFQFRYFNAWHMKLNARRF